MELGFDAPPWNTMSNDDGSGSGWLSPSGPGCSVQTMMASASACSSSEPTSIGRRRRRRRRSRRDVWGVTRSNRLGGRMCIGWLRPQSVRTRPIEGRLSSRDVRRLRH